MKKINKTLLAAAISVGMVSGASAATVNFPSTAAAPAPYGQTIVNESTRTVITPAATVITLGAGEALSVDDAVTLTLSGGAVFAAVASGDLTGGGGTYAIASGGVGQNFVKYRVTGAPAAAAVVTFAATATYTGTGVANSGNVQTTVDMSGFVGGEATALFGTPLVSLNTTLAPMMTAATTLANVGVFDVATGFLQLTAATSSTGAPGPYLADGGTASVAVTINAAAAVGATTAGVPAAGPTLGNTVLTVNGPMAGVASIGVTGGITSSGAAGAAATAVGGTVANFLELDATNNAAYGVATGVGPYVITVTFDGTTVGEPTVYTADVTRSLDAAGYAATSVATGMAVSTLTRNGSSFTSNSVGGLNKLTVTDRSGAIGAGGADGAINVSAYAADGTAVTCTMTVPNLPNNGTVTIQGADIQAGCPGAKRVEGIVSSTSIIVTNVKVTADGATASPALSSAAGTAGI